MRLYCLSGDPNKPCNVITFKGMTFMLDCSLMTQTVLSYLPLTLVPSARIEGLFNWRPRELADGDVEKELKECCGRLFVDSCPEFLPPQDKLVSYSSVDVILISNYSCMMGLPYITEGTDFKGVVYATEPTVHIGRMFLEELVEYIEQTPKLTEAVKWKELLHVLPPPLCEAYRTHAWRRIYDRDTIKKCLSRIRTVGYNQKIDLYGEVQLTAVSSGYCLGSSNWVIDSKYEKVAYVSGSSTLTTHPKPMDQGALKNANVLIMTALTQTPMTNPDAMLGELCMTVATTLRMNGCVLIPCYPSGVVYDLFECLSSHLDNTGHSQIPMFFISPVAKTSLAYSNILAEWLSSAKQNKVYMPDDPFPHAVLTRTGRLKHFEHIYSDSFTTEYKQPCVVFAGHPSLRFGDAVHFMEMWCSNPANTVIFTEPDFPYGDVLAPFQPLAMKIVYCPIDTSLNFTQVNKLIRELKPGTLVVPDIYLNPPAAAPHRNELLIEKTDRTVIGFKRDEVVKIPLMRKWSPVSVAPTLADKVTPAEVRPNVSFATVTGRVQVKGNKNYIESLNNVKRKKPKTDLLSHKRPPYYTHGQLEIECFVRKLAEAGIVDVKVEKLPTGHLIHLPTDDALIQVEEASTHIITENNEPLRLRLRKILLECVKKF